MGNILNLNNDLHNSLGIAYRDQWNQLPDRPRTMSVRLEKFIPKNKGTELLLSGYFIRDRIGVFTNTDFKFRIATFFSTRDDREAGFSAGLNLGLGVYNVDLSDLAYLDEDPQLFQTNSNALTPNVGLGVMYFNTLDNEDVIQLGISIPHFYSLDRTYSNEFRSFDIKNDPHYYFTGNYFKTFSEETFLEFSTWMRYIPNVPFNYDVNVRYRFSPIMWVGAGVNNSGIIHTEAGIIYKMQNDQRIQAGYAFNATFATHSIIFGNIHEFNVSYFF